MKVAQQSSNQYDASRTDGSGPAWYEWTKNYLVGQAPDVEPLLNWAELQGSRKIAMEEIATLSQDGSIMTDADAPDPSVLGGHIWQYLNAALIKNAAEVFRNLPMRHGLEAWRRIYRWIHSGSAVQRRTLKKRVDNPASAKDVGQVAMAVETWETNIRLLKSASGNPPSDEERRMTLAELLPKSMRDQLLWKYDDFEDYEAFKTHVLSKAEELEYMDREGRRGGQV